jgi:hypothetical protein
MVDSIVVSGYQSAVGATLFLSRKYDIILFYVFKNIIQKQNFIRFSLFQKKIINLHFNFSRKKEYGNFGSAGFIYVERVLCLVGNSPDIE